VGFPPLVSVLIVDDHEDSRVAASLLIQTFGVLVRTARDGEEALQLIAAHPPDLILCDLQMPRLDGFALVRRLRADRRLRDILVIATTGLGAPADVVATREAGFDGHVVKPITWDVIVRLLERVRSTKDQPRQQQP